LGNFDKLIATSDICLDKFDYDIVGIFIRWSCSSSFEFFVWIEKLRWPPPQFLAQDLVEK
jgi:hypothetical protein